MTPTPPSTTSSSAGAHSPEGQYRVVRKRNRVPLSCAPCRHRKLKCNRTVPCDNCVKRGDAASCTYAAPTGRKKSSQSTGDSKTPDDMQNRIDRLEGLVLSLMTNGSQAAGPTAAAAMISSNTSNESEHTNQDLDESPMLEDEEEESETEEVTKSFGIMKVDNKDNKTIFIGEAHWAAILNDIAEVRNYWKTHKREYEDQMVKVSASTENDVHDTGPALLFGSTKPPPRNEILSVLPSRYLTDILIARYFNTFDPATHILHGPTFHKQYSRYWDDPSETSIVWVAMLFSMLRLSMLSYYRQGDEPPEFRGKSLDLSVVYRTQMAHCLILADYTKPHAFIIETLIFHLHGEYTRSRETDASVWVLVGMIARLAMRMGYHRDSRWYPDISPFQGEMRRRVWTFVRQADLLFSFQMSLSAMIRTGDSDTDIPRNIYDDEFDEESKELPASRPSSEPTPVSYMIAKARLAFGFGRVMELMNSVNITSYEEIMKADNGLREIFQSLPEHLQLKEMNEMLLDPLLLIISRFGLAIIYHKAQLVLHRRFLKPARTNPRYVHSRRQCLDSAMIMLKYQITLNQEIKPKGRMRSMKWHLQSMMTHDFLLAATIICMDLHYGMQGFATSPAYSGSVYTWGVPRPEDMIETLVAIRDIWSELRDESMVAYKASELLTMILEKVDSNDPSNVNVANSSKFPVDIGDEKQNAAMTLGLLSSGGMTPNPAQQQQAQQSQQQRTQTDASFPLNGTTPDPTGAFNAPSPFGMNMFGNAMELSGAGMGSTGGMNLDWDAWDTYMQSLNQPLPNYDPANSLWATAGAGNAPSPNSGVNGSNNPFSSSANPSNSTSYSQFGNPASPGSLAGILNPGLLYGTGTGGNGTPAVDTPPSSTGGSGASPPQQNQQQEPKPSQAEINNVNGPFMGNPESNVMGTGNGNWNRNWFGGR